MTDLHPLPPWFVDLRPNQQEAIDSIIDAFSRVDVVFLEGPTGTGKTLIAQRVAAEMQARAVYVCSDKSLQDQFLGDYPYARVLKGRANYPTEMGAKDKTAEDCTSDGQSACWYCTSKGKCPYQIAKVQAMASPMAVLNTAYFMTESNYVGNFGGSNRRELVIADEADQLEGSLMGFVEFRIPRYVFQKSRRLKMPVKGARKTTLVRWLDDVQSVLGDMEQEAKRQKEVKFEARFRGLRQEARFVQKELVREIEAHKLDEDTEDLGMWLRDYSHEGTFCMKPVMVGGYGTRYLWRHGRKWLVMSATIISADEMAESLGLGLEYEVVSVPMSFPVEHRPIIVAPIANVVYKEMDEAKKRLALAVQRILEKHPPEERVLVHTVSFHLARYLHDTVPTGDRRFVMYQEGKAKQWAIDTYLDEPGSVMFAASMERGVDLADDKCRVQVVAKVPYMALGDPIVGARTRLPGGQMWYTVNAIRDVVQMTGRGVRSEDDWCVTYILDVQFTKNLWGKSKGLFPGWWREAVDKGQDIRWMMR